MNRIPPIYWLVGLGAGIIGLLWMKQRSQQSAGTKTGTPQFTQQQEVQDFQIFSALTSQQQASDLNVVGTVAQLFAGGPATGSATGGSGGAPSPPSTGQVPPATQSAYNTGLQGALSGPGTAPGDAGLAAAINATPPNQRGSLENFFLWNQANQQSGYDYFSPNGLVTTPLGVAPGEP